MNLDYVFKCFPARIRDELIQNTTEEEFDILEEIRIRNNLPIILKLRQSEKIINYIVCSEDMEYIMQKICENSIYSYQNQIINGFVTLQGGHRVGIVGTAVINDENKVSNLNYISSLNFRISRQVLGCSDKIIDEIINKEKNTIYNTLIISAPGKGKTTILRDITRNISNGIEGKLKRFKCFCNRRKVRNICFI
jgi:stage III sporulation protein AA